MARPVRFVHAADLHLDAPFAGVDASDERVRAALVRSTYDALDRIVGLCLDRHADFLALSGDVYNASEKSLKAQLRFQAAMRRLSEAGVPVFVVHGNHDPASGWSAGLEMPATVTVFPHTSVVRVEVAHDGEPVCAVYGRSFGKAAETANLAAGYRRGEGDPVAVALLHTNVGGNTEYEPYAPASLDDLRVAGMDYWALGHIHKPGRLSDEPRVVYAGCPQGLNPKESGPRGCYFVEIDDGAVTEEFVETSAVRWESRELDVGVLDGIESLRSALRDTCDSVRVGAEGRPSILRLDLVGRGLLHSQLARQGVLAQLVDETRDEQLGSDDWVWLDRVRDTSLPAIDVDRLREQPDFAGDLVRIVDDLLADKAAAAELISSVRRPIEDRTGALTELELDPLETLERARDVCLDRFLSEVPE